MRDYLGDMLTRIKNGQKAKLREVFLHEYTPKSCINVLELLEKEGYIYGWVEGKKEEIERNNLYITKKNKEVKRFYTMKKSSNTNTQIKVLLKYNGQGKSVIQGIYRISKPGCRVFVSTKALWKPKSGIGMFILSTPFGVLTDRDARHFNVGGELLCGIF